MRVVAKRLIISTFGCEEPLAIKDFFLETVKHLALPLED